MGEPPQFIIRARLTTRQIAQAADGEGAESVAIPSSATPSPSMARAEV